jgi:hypothetical protein
MKELKIEGTKNSPEVMLDPGGLIRIKGRSIHENIIDFFLPVQNWISEYVSIPAEVTCVDINLEYFNSASAKLMIQMLQRISRVRLKNKKFIVNWYYEEGDEDILERGQYFSSVLGIPFNFIRLS